MALREDRRPDLPVRADGGSDDVKVFDADEDVEGLKKAMGNGSG